MTVGAICFDATGTLIEATRPVGEVYREVAFEFGVELPAWRLEDAFRRVLRHQPARGLTGDDPSERRENEIAWWFEVIRQTFQATDSTVRFEDFPGFAGTLFDRYQAPGAWRLRPGIAETIARLRRSGLPAVVISNFDHRLLKILEDLEISSFFESIWIPFQHGFEKSDRRLFEAISARLERPVGDLAYVGDDAPETLAAIAALGVRVLDVREVKDLSTVADLLDSAATLPAEDASSQESSA